MKLKSIIFITIFCFISGVSAALTIKGTIELNEHWQPKVFLAALNSPEDIFVASPDFIIAETFIQPDGTFEIFTQTVPGDFIFYRLYLVRGGNSLVELSTFKNRNYIHLLLNRSSSVQIEASVYKNAIQVNKLNGSDESKILLDFDKNYLAHKEQFSGNLTKTKSNYLTQDLEDYIRSFVRTAPNSLIGLYALYHIDGMDTDFLRNSDFYFDFQKRLAEEFPGTAYLQAYDELLDGLVGFREFVCEMPGVQPKWKDIVLLAQGMVILFLLTVVVYLARAKRNQRLNSEGDQLKVLFESLTTKQQEILELLAEGKTNKEIALVLFVELSTVKTHINNIYRQLGVSTRKEAADVYFTLKK